MKNMVKMMLAFLGLPLAALALPTGDLSPPEATDTVVGALDQGKDPSRLWSTNCGNYGFLRQWYYPGAVQEHSRQKRQAYIGGGIMGNMGGSAAASSSASSAAAAGGGMTSTGGVGNPYASYGFPYGYPFYGGYVG